MKKFTFTLLTVLLIGLYSCSSDDPLTDTGGNSNTSQRKITKIEKLNQQGTIFSTEILTYDSQGRWIKSEETADNQVKAKTISYSANTITFRDNYYNEETIFGLKNNLIVSRGDESYDSYHYSNGYLSRIGTGSYADFEYSNGNLSKVVEDDGDSYYNITYTDYPDKIGINIFEPSYNDGDLEVRPNNPLYQFGYFGKKSNNLIKTVKGRYYNGNTDTFTYSYSFDSEGYVTEMIAQGGYPSYIKYIFYYE